MTKVVLVDHHLLSAIGGAESGDVLSIKWQFDILKSKGVKVLVLDIPVASRIGSIKDNAEWQKILQRLEVESVKGSSTTSLSPEFRIDADGVRTAAQLGERVKLDLRIVHCGSSRLIGAGRFSLIENDTGVLLDWLENVDHPYSWHVIRWTSELAYIGMWGTVGLYTAVMAGVAPLIPIVAAIVVGWLLRSLNPEQTITNATLIRANLSMTVFTTIAMTIAILAFGLNPFSWMALAAAGAGMAFGLMVYAAFRRWSDRRERTAWVDWLEKQPVQPTDKKQDAEEQPKVHPKPGQGIQATLAGETQPTIGVAGKSAESSADTAEPRKSDTPGPISSQ